MILYKRFKGGGSSEARAYHEATQQMFPPLEMKSLRDGKVPSEQELLNRLESYKNYSYPDNSESAYNEKQEEKIIGYLHTYYPATGAAKEMETVQRRLGYTKKKNYDLRLRGIKGLNTFVLPRAAGAQANRRADDLISILGQYTDYINIRSFTK